MQFSTIAGGLPATLDWIVVFDLRQVLSLTTPDLVRAMFFIPAERPLDAIGHIVLAPGGPYLVPESGASLIKASDGKIAPAAAGQTMAGAYGHLLSQVRTDGVICVGLGQTPPFDPVVLSVELGEGEAIGTAVLSRKPTGEHFELLPACGVRFLGSHAEGEFILARFSNRLSVHLFSGLLASFSRTGHCNDFFLNQTRIDERLASGLIKAGRARLKAARERSMARLGKLALNGRKTALAMTCLQPGTGEAYPYGDLVPLGLVARALATGTEPWAAAATELVRRHLHSRSQGGLWAYHSGTLETATDSSLILLGVEDAVAVEALEIFSDGAGGYLPQRCATVPGPGEMAVSDANRHWCQADLGTTCIIRALRRRHGLAEHTPLALLDAAFNRRSGLYFSNPYLTDWAFALAIADDPDAAELRKRLAAEIVAGMQPDFSFGRFDPALSTALAILALAALGYRGRLLHCAQVRLIEMVDSVGQWPAATPFYSTLAVADGAVSEAGLLRCGSTWHALSLYEDTYRMIGGALAVLALGEDCDPWDRDVPGRPATGDAPARYSCADAAEYVRRFALPPYLDRTGQIA